MTKAAMNNIKVWENSTPYAELMTAKQTWEYQQAIIDRLASENTELIKANIDVAKINADYLFDNIELKNQIENMQIRMDVLSDKNLNYRIENAKRALSTFIPPKPAKVGWLAGFKKGGQKK